jgi:hypothetical protein
MKPWTKAAFELLQHAELHRIDGGDFDRRTALIAYDNAIEISIATYLSLHPSQREGLELSKADTDKWLVSYLTKLEFLEYYVIAILQERMAIGRDEILYFHRIRNDLYHGSRAHVPSLHDVKGIRAAALWVFAILFKINPEQLLTQRFDRSRRSPEKKF